MRNSFGTYFKNLLPRLCVICNSTTKRSLCNCCYKKFYLTHLKQQNCLGCATKLIPELNYKYCAACISKPNYFNSVYAAVNYQYPWNKLISQFKFKQNFAISMLIAQLMQKNLAINNAIKKANIIIPIPLSYQVIRQRGFNQCVVLGKYLAPNKLHSNWLIRKKHTKAQHLLSKTQRFKNLTNAFYLRPNIIDKISQQHILLLDDVMTSGATLNEVAKVIKLAGADTITAIVFAKTQPHE